MRLGKGAIVRRRKNLEAIGVVDGEEYVVLKVVKCREEDHLRISDERGETMMVGAGYFDVVRSAPPQVSVAHEVVPCSAILSDPASQRSRGLWAKCRSCARYLVDGKPMCRRHAGAAVVDIMTGEGR